MGQRVSIQTEDFDLSAEVARLRGNEKGIGAVCSFVGTVRDRNDGQSVSSMELEHYPGMTEKAIEQAEEDYRINQSRYQAQLSTTTNVLDAQTRLTRAKINYFDALYNYRISLMRLAWATGTLL